MAINYDLTNTGPEVQQILNESAEHAAAIEQLQTGKQDVIEDLEDIRDHAMHSYEKPVGGIPKSDLSIPVAVALDRGSSAYQLPSSGIPKGDLAPAVQTSLRKADTAIQEVKTINGESIEGSGNINVATDISGKVDKTTTVNGHALSNNVTVTKGDVGLGNVTNDAQIPLAQKGVAGGVASLGSDGKVPSSQLPDIDISGKADKATTLAGYGITDGYTKAEGQALEADISAKKEEIDTTLEQKSAEINHAILLNRAEINAAQLEIGAVQTDEKPTEFSANHLTSGAVYNSVSSITGREKNVVFGKYLWDNKGTLGDDANWCVSDVIPCKAGDSIELNTGWKSGYAGKSNNDTFYAYLDGEESFLNAGSRSGTTPPITFTVPNNDNIAYIKCSFHKNGFNDAYVKINGNIVFLPHGNEKGSAETTAENVVNEAFDKYENGEEIDITYDIEVAEANYKYKNGEKVQSNNSFYTKPYALLKGDTVIVNSTETYSFSDVDVLGYVDSDNVYHKLLNQNSNASGEVSYTLQEDCDVVFSVTRPSSRIGIGVFFKVQRKSQNDKWFDKKQKKYYEDWLLGQPQNWPVVGGIFDFNGMIRVGYQDAKAQLINCREGDIFVINVSYGLGNTNKNAWCVTDEEGNVLDSGGNHNYVTCVDYELTIPTGGRYLFVTSVVTFTNTYVYKKVVEEPELEIVGEDFSDLHHVALPSRVIPSVGEKFTNANAGNWSVATHSIPVAAGEVYRLTTFIEPDSGTSYYAVLDSNLIVIQKVVGKMWTFGLEITIPDGGCYLLFNTSRSGIVYLHRIKCADSLKKTEYYKEPMLLGMSMRNAVSDSVSAVVKRLTFSWISDTHYDMTNYKRFIEFSNFYKGVIDAVLNTGDNNHMSDTDNGFVNTALKYVPEMPMMNCLGNHDAFGQSRHGSGNSLVSGSKLWNGEKYIKPFLDSNCVAGEDYCYYYRDFTEQKIRVIVLNDYDKPRWADGNYWITTTDESEIAGALEFDSTVTYNVGDVVHYKDQYLKCKTQSKLVDDGTTWPSDAAPVAKTSIHCRYMTQKQVDFIIAAMNVENGWSIIFASHQTLESIDSNTELASEKWNSHSNYTFNKVQHGFGQNGYIIQDLIVAYLNRTTLNKTYKCITPNTNPLAPDAVITNLPDFYPDVVVNVDFSSAVGDVICFLNGHQHSDSCYYSSHTGTKKFLTIGNINGGYVDIDGDNQTGTKFYGVWNHADVIKGGVYSRDCFNVISFDTTEKAVYLLRIGADVNDQFVKRDFVRISYNHDE